MTGVFGVHIDECIFVLSFWSRFHHFLTKKKFGSFPQAWGIILKQISNLKMIRIFCSSLNWHPFLTISWVGKDDEKGIWMTLQSRI